MIALFSQSKVFFFSPYRNFVSVLVHEKTSTGQRETGNVLWLFLKAQVFDPFARKRAFYITERQVIVSTFQGLFFIFLAMNRSCVENEVCLNVAISYFTSLLKNVFNNSY